MVDEGSGMRLFMPASISEESRLPSPLLSILVSASAAVVVLEVPVCLAMSSSML